MGFHRLTTGVSISISISIQLGVVFMAFMAVISVGFFSFYRGCIWSLCGYFFFTFFFSFSLFIYDIYTEQTQQRHNNCSICDMVSLSLARLSAERVFLSGYCWRHSFVYILYIISLFFFADKVA